VIQEKSLVHRLRHDGVAFNGPQSLIAEWRLLVASHGQTKTGAAPCWASGGGIARGLVIIHGQKGGLLQSHLDVMTCGSER